MVVPFPDGAAANPTGTRSYGTLAQVGAPRTTDLGCARLDLDREIRTGTREVV